MNRELERINKELTKTTTSSGKILLINALGDSRDAEAIEILLNLIATGPINTLERPTANDLKIHGFITKIIPLVHEKQVSQEPPDYVEHTHFGGDLVDAIHGSLHKLANSIDDKRAINILNSQIGDISYESTKIVAINTLYILILRLRACEAVPSFLKHRSCFNSLNLRIIPDLEYNGETIPLHEQIPFLLNEIKDDFKTEQLSELMSARMDYQADDVIRFATAQLLDQGKEDLVLDKMLRLQIYPDNLCVIFATLCELNLSFAYQCLLRLLDSQKSIVHALAAECMHVISQGEMVISNELFEKLSLAVNDSNPSVRIAALRTLSMRCGEKAVQSLIAGLDDPDPTIRESAENMLFEMPNLAPKYKLMMGERYCHSSDPQLRGKSIDVVSNCNDRSLEPFVLKMLNDESDNVAMKAIHALGCLGSTTSIPPLENMRERFSDMQWVVDEAISSIRERDKLG